MKSKSHKMVLMRSADAESKAITTNIRAKPPRQSSSSSLLSLSSLSTFSSSSSSSSLLSYHERIEEALSRSISKMEPYMEGKTGSTGPGPSGVFYPHVELGTAPIEVEHIHDVQKAFKYQQRTNTKKKESCMIESTTNSVRISFLLKQQQQQRDPLEVSILYQWMRLLAQYAEESYQLLRKKPVEGYSVTFLLTNKLLTNTFNNNTEHQIEAMILHFLSQLDKECSDIKLQVNAQARYVTTTFLKAFNE